MREVDSSQVVGLQLLGSKAYGQLRDLIADDQGVLKDVESSAWAQGVFRKNPRASIPQELQQRGYDCLQAAATVQTGEKVLKAQIELSEDHHSTRALIDMCLPHFYFMS